ncbi:hypothetical protein BEH_07415 [Priestia filamentosa]|uniref:Uncharacterized protein n=1 Tax=Priestia filamentosa TaxID=1402861 RepID=A0A0H4KUG5_9BACI|nr:hypothetical protein [Priestia filamentosa]AKO91943.1 hypothetical protein BEH_07415 [Priestia filamentosa]
MQSKTVSKRTDKNKVNAKKKELKRIALEHKEYFSKVSVWDKYARENNLPLSHQFQYYFESWHNAKIEIGLSKEAESSLAGGYSFSDEELLEIGKRYMTASMGTIEWDCLARKNNLPRYSAFARRFGSWEQTKKVMGLTKFKTTEELLRILKENEKYLETVKKWSKYAEKSGLPSHRQLMRIFKCNWTDVKRRVREAAQVESREYSDVEIISLLVKHFPSIVDKSYYQIYAKEHRLPSMDIIMDRLREIEKMEDGNFIKFLKNN